MKNILILFLGITFSYSAMAIETGKDLQQACLISQMVVVEGQPYYGDRADSEKCIYFLKGFLDGMYYTLDFTEQTLPFCRPPEETLGETLSSVAITLTVDSTYHNDPAGIALIFALRKVWQCNR